jgi:hypothetical protein
MAFPFSVKNESLFFDMRDTEMLCGIHKIQWSGGGGGIMNMVLKDNRQATISPGDNGIFRCSIQLEGGESSPFNLVEGHISISVTYRTLWLISRKSPETDFNWFTGGSSPHWVKGKIAN